MKLLQPLQIGPLTLPNRVFMAPSPACAAWSRVMYPPR